MPPTISAALPQPPGTSKPSAFEVRLEIDSRRFDNPYGSEESS
jgi:hypothetical protein